MFSNKDLRKLIFPLVIEQALVMMVGIVDTVMVSYVGEAAISGVALVDMINYLIIVVLSAIGWCGNRIPISGKEGQEKCRPLCQPAPFGHCAAINSHYGNLPCVPYNDIRAFVWGD